MLTAKARDRLQEALAFNPDRKRVTVRRDDLRETLGTLAQAVQALSTPDPEDEEGPVGPGVASWIVGALILLAILSAAGAGYLLHS